VEYVAYYFGLGAALLLTYLLRHRFSFMPLDWDYGIYGYQAQWFLKEGKNPLEGNIDRKFLIRRGRYGYNLIFLFLVWLCGSHPRRIRFFDTCVYLLTETAVFFFAFSAFGAPVAVIAAFLFGIFSSMPFTWTADGNSEKYTIFFDTVSLLMLALWWSQGGYILLVLAGLCGFCSTATKQSNLFLYAAITCWLLFASGMRAAALFAAVFVLLYAIVLGYYRLCGVPWMHLLGVFFVQPTQRGLHYLRNTEVRNGQWVKRQESNPLLKRFWSNVVPHMLECGTIWVLGISGLVWAFVSGIEPLALLLIGAFAGTLLGFLAPNKFYPYYYIPFIPLLSVFGGMAAAKLLSGIMQTPFSRFLNPAVTIPVAGSAISCGIALPRVYRFFFSMSPTEQAQYTYQNSLPNFLSSEEIAKYVKLETSPSDHIFVYSINPEIYFLSGRRSSIEHVYLDSVVLGLMNEKERADWQRRIVRQLRENRPKLIVMMSDAMTIEEFERMIGARYELAAVFDSKTQPAPDDKYRVYKMASCPQHVHSAGARGPAKSLNEARTKHTQALVLHAQGKDDEALTLLRESSDLNPHDSGVLQDLANLLLNKGRLAEAVPLLEELVKRSSREVQNIVSLACAHEQMGNYEEAVGQYEKILSAEGVAPPDSAALWERLGKCRLAMKEYEHGGAAFRNAVNLNPNSASAHIGLGLCLFNERRTSEARLAFEKALALDPNCADALNNLGAIAIAEQRFDEAMILFKRALEIDPDHRDALPNFLSLTFGLGRYEHAESLLECYLKAHPNNADLAYQLAYCRFKLGRGHHARDLLEKVLAKDPEHEDARALLAECEAA